MENVIKRLKALVSSSSAVEADHAISDAFPQLSVKAASNIRKDVQDFIDGAMSESELTHYLNQAGVTA